MAAVPFVLWGLLLKRPELGAGSCPPAGEGLVMCQVQQSWAAWLTVVCIAATATHGLVWLIAVALPKGARKVHDGERLHYGTPPSRRDWQGDGTLAAAVWAPATTRNHRSTVLAERALERAVNSSGPTTDGLAVCGRCHRSHAIRGWRAVCPDCGGVALRAVVAPRVPDEARMPVAVR